MESIEVFLLDQKSLIFRRKFGLQQFLTSCQLKNCHSDQNLTAFSCFGFKWK